MSYDPTKPYVLDPSLPIAQNWDKPLSTVAALPPLALSDADKERHRIYALLLFALMRRYFNGNKNGPRGDYPWRENQRGSDGLYAGGDYLGHNIGALAVDGNGEVIDFDFNHNQIFASSAEHAEARLVRRVFGLTQLYDSWQTRTTPDRPEGYSTILSNVTIYTSLESCAQCSGVMALGEVSKVVFLQRDPGTYHIGNILYSLTRAGDKSFAPRPVPGSDIDFSYFDELNDAYAAYYGAVKDKPFWRPLAQPGAPPAQARPDTSRALTGFLCTDDALDVYQRASDELAALTADALVAPDYRPSDADGNPLPDALSNADALAHVARFAAYATQLGRRGTPHNV